MRLHVVVASTRPSRIGPRIAQWFLDQIDPGLGFEVHLVDLAEVDLPLLDEPHHSADLRYTRAHTRDWSASVAAADAFVLVMPEYNVGFTAPLKNALDFLFHEWHHKPVGFVSYGMTSGGMRAVEMLKPVLVSLNMHPVPDAVTIHLRDRVDGDGVLHPNAAMRQAAHRLLTQLQQLTLATAPLRSTSSNPADPTLAEATP
ncbi:MAG: NADPH-dependent FMN reductase [Nocardioides sp.]